jgi:hypothetical protein
MKRSAPLDRLFRAAARATVPVVAPPPPVLVQRLLAAWPQAGDGCVPAPDGASLLLVYRRGLALACGLMLLVLCLTFMQVRQPGGSPWTDPATAVTLVYSR